MRLKYSDLQKKISWKPLETMLQKEDYLEITVEGEITCYLSRHVPQTQQAPVGTSHETEEKLAALRELMALARPKQGATMPTTVPLYNPAIHKSGDTVRIFRYGKEVIMKIPLQDVDGQPIPWDD